MSISIPLAIVIAIKVSVIAYALQVYGTPIPESSDK